jgi:hypothetical protein
LEKRKEETIRNREDRRAERKERSKFGAKNRYRKEGRGEFFMKENEMFFLTLGSELFLCS